MGELAIEAPSYWERRWVFLLKVPMDDLNDPRISAYKPQRRLLLPAPPGYRSRPSKAQRRQRRQRKARAEARIARFHLVGMTGAGVIVMGCLVAAAVVVVLVLLVSHH